ncbi:MAG: SpoIIE family protein phosphatase [Egibacteraceae bacterium]
MTADAGGERPPGPVVPAENAEDLYEHAPCGYLSTLPDGTIIRVNETLLAWTGYRRDELVGRRRFVDLLTVGGRIYHETHYAPLLTMQDHAREIALDLVCADGRQLPVLVNAALVRDADGAPHVIRTSVLDATHRRAYEQELLRARERAQASELRARELARTLQANLIPPAPPAIPGLDVAAAYRPAGAGDEVGGDFYDVFKTDQGDWAVVLGDVCGKGAAAAAVTALVRHTARAAAMQTRTPSKVLATLNDALLRAPSERFCTAVYLRFCLDDDGSVRVESASAGHPLPMRLADDAVAPVGTPGTLLGVVDDPDLADAAVVLLPGEALFCYTDGLTEARRGEVQFGERRLRALLAAQHGKPASDLVQVVIGEILDFQGGYARDDMAAVLIGVPRGD